MILQLRVSQRVDGQTEPKFAENKRNRTHYSAVYLIMLTEYLGKLNRKINYVNFVNKILIA